MLLRKGLRNQGARCDSPSRHCVFKIFSQNEWIKTSKTLQIKTSRHARTCMQASGSKHRQRMHHGLFLRMDRKAFHGVRHLSVVRSPREGGGHPTACSNGHPPPKALQKRPSPSSLLCQLLLFRGLELDGFTAAEASLFLFKITVDFTHVPQKV